MGNVVRHEQEPPCSGSILQHMKIEPKEHLHMTAVVFDSLTLVKRLHSSGMPDEQAEAIVGMARDVMLNVATNDDIDAAVHTLNPKFAALDQRFVNVDQRFTVVEQRLSAIEQRLTSFEQRLGAAEQRLTAIEERLNSIDQRLASYDQRFITIDHRFEIIEQKFTILEQRLTMKLGSIVVVALGAFTAISKLIA